MELGVLGELTVTHDGRAVEIRGPKQRALLAALILRRNEAVPADVLADTLWGDGPPANPANALQAQVSQLRKALPEPVLVTRGSGYALVVTPEQVDADRFEQAVADGRRLLDAGDPARAASVLRGALALWRGQAFADIAGGDLVRGEATRLEELRLAALEARIEADLACGHHAEAAAELEARCAEHPLREHLWALRMVALYRCGRQADALRAYSDARRQLVDELGVEPGPELRRLEAMVLAHDPDLDGPAARAPERGAAPPIPTAGNLRARLTRFVGRAAEADGLTALLGTNRLVTVVGPGGAGKTRLAVEVADHLAPTVAGGAWLVELAPVTDAAEVPHAFAAALGLAEAGTLLDAAAAAPLAEQIGRHLTGRELLVVADNCEHVIDAAAALVEHLLGVVPGLRVLATSREALGVPGEALFPLTPLPRDAAVELFADRARAVDPTLVLDGETRPTVEEICERLDGLPLAIELAAARLRALPLAQVAARLDDRFRLLTGGARTALPRQQTLRAVVDWSHDLLFEDERRLFARMAVFPGGCVLDAAEAVCADELLPAEDVVDLLSRLVDKSLVVVDRDDREPGGGPRYRQLQTLWQYARERLAEAGDAETVRARHAAWYEELAREAEQGLRGAHGPAWRARLTAELDNLRAAFDWCAQQGEAATAVSIATSLSWFWFLNGEWQTGVRWLREALAVRGEVDAVAAARARAWLAYFAVVVEDPTSHLDDYREIVATLRAAGSDTDVGEACLLHASSLNRAWRCQEALAVLVDAEGALSRVGDEWGLAICDLLVATAHARLGHLDEADAAAVASVARFERVGERWALLEPMGIRAAILDARGATGDALAAYGELVDRCRRLDAPAYLAFWLVLRATTRARLGDDGAAAAEFDEATRLRASPGAIAYARLGLARTAARSGDFTAARAELGRAGDLYRALARRDGLDAVAVGCALVDLAAGDLDGAAARAAGVGDTDPAVAALAGAVAAAARGERRAARDALDRWVHDFLPALPGSLSALLGVDVTRLAATLADP